MLKASLRSMLLISLTLLMLNFVPVTAGAVTTQLTTGSTDQFQPEINGSKVVWLDGNNSPDFEQSSNVYLLSLGGAAQKLTTVKKAHAPAISAAMVVWEDLRNDTGGGILANSDIFGYTLPAGPPASAIVTDTAPQLTPDVSGSQVVWSDHRTGDWQIFLKKTDGSIVQITHDAHTHSHPRIDGDKIVWQDDRNGQWDIYLYNITSSTETRITDNGANQTEPDISGNRIVWTDYRGANKNIYAYDLSSPVANGTPVNAHGAAQYEARISGSRVVWTDWRNAQSNGTVNRDIYSKDLVTGQATRVTADGHNQDSPDVSGNRIVWADDRNVNWDIYMAVLDTVAPTASVKAPGYSSSKSKTSSFKVSWSGADPSPSSGIVSYDVRYKVGATGSWKSWKTGVTSKSAVLSAGAGSTYYFQARAKDGDGNVGAWSADAKTIVPYDQGKHVLTRHGFSHNFSDAASNFYHGTVRYSTTRDDYIIYRFYGNSFGLISTRGPDRSKFTIIVDGVNKGTFDTYASKTKYRQLVYSAALVGSGPHTVKIVNVTTAGHSRLDVDGIGIGN